MRAAEAEDRSRVALKAMAFFRHIGDIGATHAAPRQVCQLNLPPSQLTLPPLKLQHLLDSGQNPLYMVADSCQNVWGLR